MVNDNSATVVARENARITSNSHAKAEGFIERVTGFRDSYNALLWCIFGGVLLSSCNARLPMLDVNGFYASAGGAGELFHMKVELYQGGLFANLIGILIANLLAVFQFVHIIRHKAIVVHRINGYAIFLLYVLGAAGGIVITRHAYGSRVDTRTAAGALAFLVLVAFAIAYGQIKRLQIDQHRKWILRAINMMASVVTSKIILHLATALLADISTYLEV